MSRKKKSYDSEELALEETVDGIQENPEQAVEAQAPSEKKASKKSSAKSKYEDHPKFAKFKTSKGK
jgi:hypothetical protein